MPRGSHRLRRRQEAPRRDHDREAGADPRASRRDRSRSVDRVGRAARGQPQSARARRGDDGSRTQSGEDRLSRAARMTTMADEEKPEIGELPGAPLSDDEESNAYKVTVPAFHGPLDLLLHLIKKNEIDIYDIPIALITEQYNAYLEAMEQLDLEVAADFIYMAAVLINIKSKMLLPRDESAQGIE